MGVAKAWRQKCTTPASCPAKEVRVVVGVCLGRKYSTAWAGSSSSRVQRPVSYTTTDGTHRLQYRRDRLGEFRDRGRGTEGHGERGQDEGVWNGKEEQRVSTSRREPGIEKEG